MYCRECQGEAHEPCDCETWKMWLQKVSEMRPEECECLLLFCFFKIMDLLSKTVQESVTNLQYAVLF